MTVTFFHDPLAFIIAKTCEIESERLICTRFTTVSAVHNILIVDDHSITRLGVSLILKEMFNEVAVTEAYDESSAVHYLKRQRFDLMIFDINMPGSDALHLLKMAKELQPNMKNIVFSMHPEKTYARYFLHHGADGYINKEASNAVIKISVLRVLDGQKVVASELENPQVQAAPSVKPEEPAKLSFRELEVLRRLMNGLSLTDIGQEMNLHISTVSTYKTRIFQKLGVSSLLEIKDLPEKY